MKNIHTLTIIGILTAPTLGCDPSAVVNHPLIYELVDKLLPAVADLAVEKLAGDQGCELYIRKGLPLAESAWTHDWPVFKPMLDNPPDPKTDLEYCAGVIMSRGARVLSKPRGQRHSTAVKFAVFLDPDFGEKSIRRQAATMCHEAAHIVWQHRVTTSMAIADYASVSGRLIVEATAYALGDLVLRRHDVTPKWIMDARRARSERFPETYMLEGQVTPECVYDYMTSVSKELEKRVGNG